MNDKTPSSTASEPAPIEDGADFEVRADYVGDDVLREGTAVGDWYEHVHQMLLERSLKLLVGPRGCGKTHMMRYTWLRCMEEPALPFAVYASFNRYLRLEPLLKSRSDAGALFHIWVLASLVLALEQARLRVSGATDGVDCGALVGVPLTDLRAFVDVFERGLTLSTDEEILARSLSIENVVEAVRATCAAAGRQRTILLFDDAALTLTPEYMIEFFDVVRAVKRHDVSPKCSVYPGSTEYGPRFHSLHEGEAIPVWLSIDHPKYLDIMHDIARRRYPEGLTKAKIDVDGVLVRAAFGVPRAYLSLLRSMAAVPASEQVWRALNRIIQEHADGKLAEYRSLATKMPRFATVIGAGSDFFDAAISAIREANEKLNVAGDTKQFLISVEERDFTKLTERMMGFLIEAGLLNEQPEIMHGGPDRRYRRYMPHLAALIAARTFSGRTRGGSVAGLLEVLCREPTKHAVRRKLNTLLPQATLNSLRLDLPVCQQCGTARITEAQRHCTNCGARLADPSTFTRLLSLSVAEVPNLTDWQKAKLADQKIATIGEILSLQDPGTELRKIHRVGVRRAEKILRSVESYVDEFLS